MRPLSIGVTCFPTFGGSGIVATEVGLAMARRGHKVHFVCADVPCRLDPTAENVWFHPVRATDYPVLPDLPYTLALSSAMVAVARREKLDVLHTHYAVPHAVSAWMAREVLGGSVKVVTTLHGTDITVVGADESYREVTRHAILRSDAVTAPSAFLRGEAQRRFALDVPIDVIPNFVDTEAWRPGTGRDQLVALFGPAAATTPVVVHVSNFRPVKRVDTVVDVFARLVANRPAFLLLVGDGPDRPAVEAELRRRGLSDRSRLTGNREDVAELVRECAVFLLPSASESFGLAALEALASGVPVVGSAVGGVPEVVRDGETGFLFAPDDAAGMAAQVAALLDDPARLRRVAETARADVVERFRAGPMVSRYEAVYRRVVG